ncbi:MAG: PEP-CTERM sorting domain-containing protein [Isosphaeraceae bacterium]
MRPSYLAALILSALPISGWADTILWVDDASGVLGKVNVDTGAVTVVGNMGVVMTDIAFAPNGDLYGITFNGLYRINPTTAAATLIGQLTFAGANALVFGTDGTLYVANSNTTSLYRANTSTGAETVLGNIGFSSAGDLAFVAGNLYMSSSADHLIRINLAGTVSGTDIGAFGFSNVYGLATPDNNILYGVAGTQVFSVNTTTGTGTLLSNYGGRGLGQANGSSFVTEAIGVPEPSSLISLGIGVVVVSGYIVSRKCRVALS